MIGLSSVRAEEDEVDEGEDEGVVEVLRSSQLELRYFLYLR